MLIDTTPGFFFRSIDGMMISDAIITVATPSTSNVLGLKELCGNIYEMLQEDTKMILLINMIGKEGIEADKTIVEQNIEELRKLGNSFYKKNFIEVPHYGMMGERIHSFEENPNQEFSFSLNSFYFLIFENIEFFLFRAIFFVFLG